MKGKKKIIISMIGLLLIIIVGIIFIFIGQQTFISLNEPGVMWQTYPEPIILGRYQEQDWGDLLATKEAVIKTDKSTFKIVFTKKPRRIEREPGRPCSLYLANFEVYKDGKLIDTINTDWIEEEVKRLNTCSLREIGAVSSIKRAYSDRGIVYKNYDCEKDFFCEENYRLPENNSGIEVIFRYKQWMSGSGRQPGHHINNLIIYKINENEFFIENVSVEGNTVKVNVNSPGSYYIDFDGKVIDGIRSYSKNVWKGVGKGSNVISFDFNRSFERFDFILSGTLYKKTSEFKDLNADVQLFYPITQKRGMNYNQYFKIKNIDFGVYKYEKIIELDEDKVVVCPVGFEYDENLDKCIKYPEVERICDIGVYDEELGKCVVEGKFYKKIDYKLVFSSLFVGILFIILILIIVRRFRR